MLLNLTDLSDESLQSQIIRQVRAMILKGELNPHEPLPSIRQLARQEKVSVITVQRAYEALEREDLIHSRRGKGFFVSVVREEIKKNMSIERLSEGIEPIIRSALDEGMEEGNIINIINNIINRIRQ